jgi:tyrosyl-tRNA synthetase
MAKGAWGLPQWLERGVADLFPAAAAEGAAQDPDQQLAARLAEAERQGRPLRIKLGIDPTGSDIHLGHSILFRKLRAFQDAGHTAVLIIGDFTARIGDPTGKSATRVQLSEAEVEANARTYLQQLGQGQDPAYALLDFETSGRLEVRRNSEWLAALDLPKVIELLGISTVGQMLAKEDFANRYGSARRSPCTNSSIRCCRVTTRWPSRRIWSWAAPIRSSTWRWAAICSGISASAPSSECCCRSCRASMGCRR